MRQFIIKPWRRSKDPGAGKNDKKFRKIQKKLEKNCKYFLKVADIKILKNIPLQLDPMYKPTTKIEEAMWLFLRLEKPKNRQKFSKN